MAKVACEWGLAGVRALRSRCAVLVIVDVLSFCTAVDVAVGRGGEIVPCPDGDEAGANQAAQAAGAAVAGPRRRDAPSLSPHSLLALAPGTRLLLPSPNGSRLSLAAAPAQVLAGCLRNASATAQAALALANGAPIGVIPAGERWPDGSLRPAAEDLLGAGAVIDALVRRGGLRLSAEAKLAAAAFRHAGSKLAELVGDALSGRELVERGFADDVGLAAQLDTSPVASLLVDGVYRASPA